MNGLIQSWLKFSLTRAVLSSDSYEDIFGNDHIFKKISEVEVSVSF